MCKKLLRELVDMSVDASAHLWWFITLCTYNTTEKDESLRSPSSEPRHFDTEVSKCPKRNSDLSAELSCPMNQSASPFFVASWLFHSFKQSYTKNAVFILSSARTPFTYFKDDNVAVWRLAKIVNRVMLSNRFAFAYVCLQFFLWLFNLMPKWWQFDIRSVASDLITLDVPMTH